MSKQISRYFGNAYLVHDATPKQISGKVITLIETLGLPQKQEEAIKGLIFQAIDDGFYGHNPLSGRTAMYLSEETHKEIRLKYEEALKKADQAGIPVQAI